MNPNIQPRVVTLGETMYAMVPEAVGPLRYTPSFRPRITGAESNLAIGLAKLGHAVAWVSRLGEDEFGIFVNNAIRGEGVDVSRVVFDPEHRTGLMFKEQGAGETRVYYYRENSAASHFRPDDVPEDLLAGAEILHLTGITPVLSRSCEDAVWKAAEVADKHGLTLSFDPNIRRKLWGDRDYAPLLRELTLRAHIVLMGLNEAETLFNNRDPEAISAILFGSGRARIAALKDGADGAWIGNRDGMVKIPPMAVQCVEPIGAGDAFNAGFLAGMLEGLDMETCGKMGGVCGALATQVVGDIEGYPSRERLQAILSNAREVFR